MRPPTLTAAIISLIALASVTFLGKSYETSLRGIDSNIHAAVAMSVTADGFTPRLPIPMKNFTAASPAAPGSTLNPDLYFNDHPFFLFWVNGLIMRALGPSAWSARLLTGLFSVGSVLLVFALGNQLYSRAFGVLAALFLIFCRDFVLTSATVSLDTALVFFILLTFLLWQRRLWLALGLAAGVGLWIKTPLVLLVFPTALIHDAIRRRLQRNFRYLLASGVLAICVGSLVWIYTGFHGGWDLVHDYWFRQVFGTALQGRAQNQGSQLGFFFYNVRTGFLPGLPFLIIGLAQIARSRRWRQSAFLIPFIATAIIAIIVTGMRFKLGHYFTPIFPFLALISAYSIVHWVQKHEEGFYLGVTGFATLLMMVLLITPITLGPEPFVALKRFVPLIQTHGSCDDHIALVAGGEPVGSALDYTLFLNFYTGRTVDTVDCGQLAASLRTPQAPQWLIIAHENLENCLKPRDRELFSAAFLVGTQYLLTSRIPAAKIVDLTSLELELKAVTDCKAPPYPRDMWHRYLF